MQLCLYFTHINLKKKKKNQQMIQCFQNSSEDPQKYASPYKLPSSYSFKSTLLLPGDCLVPQVQQRGYFWSSTVNIATFHLY